MTIRYDSDEKAFVLEDDDRYITNIKKNGDMNLEIRNYTRDAIDFNDDGTINIIFEPDDIYEIIKFYRFACDLYTILRYNNFHNER